MSDDHRLSRSTKSRVEIVNGNKLTSSRRLSNVDDSDVIFIIMLLPENSVLYDFWLRARDRDSSISFLNIEYSETMKDETICMSGSSNIGEYMVLGCFFPRVTDLIV